MACKLSIIITTIGRESLGLLINSLRQLRGEDEVIILVDGDKNIEHLIVDPLAKYNLQIIACLELNAWNHRSHFFRNKYFNTAIGTHILHLDDDDRLAGNARNEIENVSHPDKLIIFQMLRNDGLLVPRPDHKIEFGNISTQCGIIPNQPESWGVFTDKQSGDCDFYKSCKLDSIFIDKITVLSGLDGTPHPKRPRVTSDGQPLHLFDGPEIPFFCKEISRIKNGQCVEIGAFKGGSAWYGASIARKNNTSYHIVDSWSWPGSGELEYEAFCANMLDSGLQPIIHRKSSVLAAREFHDKSLDLVFIDADHSYSAVRDDIAAWWPKLKIGGIMIGHDYACPRDQDYGVIQAVNERFGKPDEISSGIKSPIWKVTKHV